jgi:hypothetical protein
MTTAASAAGATGRGGRPTGATTHDTGAADGHTANRLTTVGMLGERVVFHALADLKALWWIALKLGNGFVNVGWHGWSGGSLGPGG